MEKNSVIDKYTYRVEWSEEDKVHIACCLEFPSLMAHGNTASEALLEIEKVVTKSVEWMKEEREPIPEPFGLKKFKGNLTLRVPSEIHKKLVIKSAEEGVSIKNPRRERRGIEDFTLKSLRMRGNKSPAPPDLRPEGRGINPYRD